MADPYVPPKAELKTNTQKVYSGTKKTIATVIALISALIYVTVIHSVFGFEDLYKGFVVELPLLTQFVFDHYYLSYILIIPCAATLTIWVVPKTSQARGLFWLSLINLLVSLVFIWAFFLPLIQMAREI